VKIGFILVALLMTLAALALVVWPMLRTGRRHGRPRHVLYLALAIVFVMPLGALGLYLHVGTPQALNPAMLKPNPDANQMIAQLREKLARKPDEKGWLLLAQIYTSQHKLAKARDAYGEALKLAPDNSDLMVAWAETDAMASDSHYIGDHARDLLLKAVKMDPRNQRGLWLLGISDYQRDQFADSALTLRRLQVLLQPDSKVAQAVKLQIAMADARASGKTQQQALALLQQAQSAPTGASAAAKANAEGAHIAVHVSLSPALRAKVKPGETLFVFARAVKGPPMPLAVARLKASALPTTVMLTDGMGMSPSLRLSSVDKVMVVARISPSGQAMPASGDLEGTVGPVSVDDAGTVDVVIDHTH
jgi:cytochrome c-type biogenesis protein CcmH